MTGASVGRTCEEVGKAREDADLGVAEGERKSEELGKDFVLTIVDPGREKVDPTSETELTATGVDTDDADSRPGGTDGEGSTTTDELEAMSDETGSCDGVESKTVADPERVPFMRVSLGIPLLGLVVPLSEKVETRAE